jgi:small-conductance mechanosensitive channel
MVALQIAPGALTGANTVPRLWRISIAVQQPFIQFAGPSHALQIHGIKLLGFDAANGEKLLFTLIFFAFLYAVSKLLRFIAKKLGGDRQETAFWARQGISLLTFLLACIGFLSIWFDNPTRLATGLGLASAGLAFALQKVITSFAGYFVILRGKTFNVGDRIKMGKVRGDVISLNFIQTVIMEMGQPPSVQDEDPGMWVQSRQYSGRIVTISNAQIFDEPVYNYSRDFPYIWEEMHIPISFKDDRVRAEQIMLDAVARHTADIANLAQPVLDRLHMDFYIDAPELKPRVYLRITDNWVELAVRFLCCTRDIRGLKDVISREILSSLENAGIGIASGTYEIVGLPPVHIEGLAAAVSPPLSRTQK